MALALVIAKNYHAADAFFGFLKNPFQDQRMKTTDMFLNIFFVHRNSTLGGGAWI
jgi:hypothetical protein